MSYHFVSRQGGYSYENSFPIVFLLKQRNRYFSPRSYIKCFHGWLRFNFRGLLGGKILRKTNFHNGWHKVDIRTRHYHFMFERSSTSTRDSMTRKYLYNVFFANIKRKEHKEKTYKNITQNLRKRSC